MLQVVHNSSNQSVVLAPVPLVPRQQLLLHLDSQPRVVLVRLVQVLVCKLLEEWVKLANRLQVVELGLAPFAHLQPQQVLVLLSNQRPLHLVQPSHLQQDSVDLAPPVLVLPMLQLPVDLARLALVPPMPHQ
jgi:hypothetical protein